MLTDIAQSPREDLVSGVVVQNAVAAYIGWQKAREHADKLQLRMHARVGQLTPGQFREYADQTTKWDEERQR